MELAPEMKFYLDFYWVYTHAVVPGVGAHDIFALRGLARMALIV